MSVKRWDSDLYYNGTGEYVPTMVEADDGDYVEFAAYEVIRKRAERAEALLVKVQRYVHEFVYGTDAADNWMVKVVADAIMRMIEDDAKEGGKP